MTAAESKIILDKGSDYRLQLKVRNDDNLTNRDLTNWGWVFEVYNSAGERQDTMCIGKQVIAGQIVEEDCDSSVLPTVGTYVGTNYRLWLGERAYKFISSHTMVVGDTLLTLIADNLLALDGDVINGQVTIQVPGEINKHFSTGLTVDLFSTVYNYFYTLTFAAVGTEVTEEIVTDGIITTGASYQSTAVNREMRVLRGKLAVRI